MTSQRSSQKPKNDRDSLFGDDQGNQKDSLIKEIRELTTATSASISAFEPLLTSVKLADLKASGREAWVPQYEKVHSAYQTYKGLVDDIRSRVAKSKNTLKDFYRTTVPGIIDDDDDDTIEELGAFLKKGFKEVDQENGLHETSFNDVLTTLQSTVAFFEEALDSAKVQDAEIIALKKKVEALQVRKKTVDKSVKALLDEALEAANIKRDSPRILILINTAVKSLITALTYLLTKKRATTTPVDTEKLNASVKEAADIEQRIKKHSADLSKLANKKGRLDEEKQRWQEINIDVALLTEQISELTPKLSSIGKVTDALKTDIKGYLDFIKGSGRDDKGRKWEEKANMEDAGKVYQTLSNALETFATSVV